jgi:hypothetical protein
MQQIDKIKINKSVVMYSPIEGEYTLCRTGTIDTCFTGTSETIPTRPLSLLPGSSALEQEDLPMKSGPTNLRDCSFLHSILHATSQEYIDFNIHDRNKYTKTIQNIISKRISKKEWEKIENGVISKTSFKENFMKILSLFYNKDKQSNIIKNKDDREVQKIILKITCLYTFENKILPNIYKKYDNEKIKVYTGKILKYTIDYISRKLDSINYLELEYKNYIIEKFTIFMKRIIHKAYDISFKNFIDSVFFESTSRDYIIDILSDYFNIDIYFIKSDNRLPFKSSKILHRKSIIILSINDIHYEIVGRLLHINRIQREFNMDDSIIIKIEMFLHNPGKILKYYPDLCKYLKNDTYFKTNKKSPSINIDNKNIIENTSDNTSDTTSDTMSDTMSD